MEQCFHLKDKQISHKAKSFLERYAWPRVTTIQLERRIILLALFVVGPFHELTVSPMYSNKQIDSRVSYRVDLSVYNDLLFVFSYLQIINN